MFTLALPPLLSVHAVDSTNERPNFSHTSALESRGLLELVVTMRQVMEDHSPNDASSDASALGQKEEGRTDRDRAGGVDSGGDRSINEGAAPGRPPVARWMRDE